jgi:hypothetical protein
MLARRLKLCGDLAGQAELELDSGDPEAAQQAVLEYKRNSCPGLKDATPLRAGLEDQIKKLMMNPKAEGGKDSGDEEVEDWPEDDQKAEELAEEFANAGDPDETVQTWPEEDDEPQETAAQTPPQVEQQRPPTPKCDMTGVWRRSGWTQYATFTITQSGNKMQWAHDYLWGAGMRHEQANGTVTDEGSGSASVIVDIDYTEPDRTRSHAQYGGSVTCNNGRAIRVWWNNNSEIVREQ